MKLSDRYIHHRNLLQRGHQEIALYIAIFNVSMLLSVFLRTMLHLRATWIALCMVVCIIGILVICYLFGWKYNNKKLFEKESLWHTSRNPDIQEIKDGVKAIKRILSQSNPEP